MEHVKTNSENWELTEKLNDESTRRSDFIHQVYNTIHKYSVPYLSMEELDEIIGEEMEHEWMNNEYDPNGFGLDTCVREEVFDRISIHYLGRSWPTYGDEGSFETFLDRLKNAIESSRS